MNLNKQPAPDFGEPWHEQEPPHPISHDKGVYWLNPSQFNRAVSCVNACAGMADPAAEIQAMRDAIKEIYAEADACANGDSGRMACLTASIAGGGER